jgi:hypothetical protein
MSEVRKELYIDPGVLLNQTMVSLFPQNLAENKKPPTV